MKKIISSLLITALVVTSHSLIAQTMKMKRNTSSPAATTAIIKNTSSPAEPMKIKSKKNAAPGLVSLPVLQFNVPGGGIIKRRIIDPNSVIQRAVSGRQKDQKINEQLVADQGNCKIFTARVSTVERDEMPTISNGNQIEYFVPGLIFDVRDIYNGTLLDKEKFPYSQNRNPIEIMTSVRNNNGPVVQAITKPDRFSINQAVANFYQTHTSDADKTSIQNFRYYACAINSKEELALKIGASGHYVFASMESNFEIKNSKEYKTLYFEATKELFTMSARPATEEGFFSSDPGDISRLGFISQVTYGIKIIGKVEVQNEAEEMRGSMKAAFDAGIAGVEVNMSSFTAKSAGKTIVTLYAVGGRADMIGTCTVNNIQETIDRFLKNVNYKVAQPIKLRFTTLDNKPFRYMDATDNFNYEICTPKALESANERLIVNSLMLAPMNKTASVQLYGKVWVRAFDGAGKEIPETRNSPQLFYIKGEDAFEWDKNPTNISPNTESSFFFPKGSINGGYTDVFFQFFERDANADWGNGDDEQYKFITEGTDFKTINVNPPKMRPNETVTDYAIRTAEANYGKCCWRRLYFDKFSGPAASLNLELVNQPDDCGMNVFLKFMRLAE